MGDTPVSLDGSVGIDQESNHYVPPVATVLVHDKIRNRAEVQPDAEAICSWDCMLSYGELDSLSSRLAGYIASHGVGPEVIVPLVFEKSGWAVVSMLAVMKAGGAFLPLDVSQPDARLRSIIEQSGATVALASATCYEFCSSSIENTFAVSKLALAGLNTPFHLQNAALNNAAYVMSTSGSTGTPKIVVTEHSQLASFVAYLTKPLGFTDKTRTFQFASYAFDPIIGDIFLTLAAGGTVCIPSDVERKNDLVGAMRRLRVTLAKFTPSLVASLTDLTPARVPTLKTLVLGGETALPSVIEAWASNVDLKLIYGSTECTISCVVTDASTRTVLSGEIGRPIGSQAWVIDPNNVENLVNDGEVGELIVGGPLVARGYSNNPSQTKSKFVSPPTWFGVTQSSSQNDCRLYRTGDLVRRVGSGNLVYVGRVDNQIKIHGQRLELEEAEQHLRQALTEVPSIRIREILVDGSAPLGTSTKRLVAFLCVEGKSRMGSLLFNDERGATINLSPATQHEFAGLVSKLDAFMRSKVPSYMVPSIWIPIDEMPYTLSRKRDRQRLRKAVQSLPTNWLTSFSSVDSRLFSDGGIETGTMTKQETLLQRLWSGLFNVSAEAVHLADNFFHLGGDSLMVLRLISMARQESLYITADDVFTHPVLRDLAAKIMHETASVPLSPFALLDTTQRPTIHKEAAQQCGVVLDGIEDIYPLYSMQEHYITGYPELGRDIAGPWDWKQQIVFLLPDGFDIPRFKSVWHNAVERHSQLRTRVVQTSYGMFQAVLRKQFVPTWRDAAQLEEYVRQDKAAIMSFGDELLRLAIANSGRQHYFVFTIQHLIYDAYSRDMLFKELEAEFQQGALPTNAAPPPEMNQFINYVTKADRESAIDFWSSYLEGSKTLPLLSVPLGSCRVNELHIYKTKLNKPAPVPLSNFTMATILEVSAGLAIAARLYCDDVIFNSDRAGRNLPVDGIQDLMGPTTLFLPTRVHIDRAKTVYDLLCAHQLATAAMIPFEYLNWTEMREMEHLKCTLAHSVNLNINLSTMFGNLGESMGLQVVDEHETRDDPFSINVSVSEDAIEWAIYYDYAVISQDRVRDLTKDLQESFLSVWEACKNQQIVVGTVLDHIREVSRHSV